MKKILALILMGLPFICHAQEFELVSSPNGIWITIQTDLKKEVLTIERKEGSGAFAPLVTLRPPTSEEELAARLSDYTSIIPDQRPVADRAQELWIWINNREFEHPLLRSPVNQLAVGRAWLDKSAQPGKTYYYRIRGNQKNITYQQGNPFESRWTYIRDTTKSPYPVLAWYSQDGFATEGVRVQRGVKGRGDFQTVLPLWQVYRSAGGDSVFIRMQDTTLTEEGQYEYLVQPVDRFGNPGRALRPVTRTFLVESRRPYITNFSIEENRLHWEVKHPDLLRSIHVYRGRSMQGPFERIAVLTADKRSFSDHRDVPMETMYYYLSANDVRGEYRKSLVVSMVDESERVAFTPAAPKVMQGDSGVIVRWERPYGSVRGYRVLRREGYRGKWKPASPFLPATRTNEQWIDTSAVLQTGQLYSYALVAESESYQESPISEQRTVRIRQTQSLRALHWVEARLGKGGVVVRWENLFAREPALKGYRVYRHPEGLPEASILLAEINDRQQNKYIDQNLAKPGDYVYQVESFDLFGNRSGKSQGAFIQWVGQPMISVAQLSVRELSEGIQLNWRGNQQGEQMQIFRSENGAEWKLIHQSNAEKGSIIDEKVVAGRLYQYQVQTGNGSAAASGRSKPVLIRY